MEPGLGVLAADIASQPAACGYCRIEAWYGFDHRHLGHKGFKARMLSLVGFGRAFPGSSVPDGMNVERVVSVPLDEMLKAAIARKRRRRAWLATLPQIDAYYERLLHSPEAYDTAYRHLFDLIPVLPPGAVCACDEVASQ
jgi:hypothetical protein